MHARAHIHIHTQSCDQISETLNMHFSSLRIINKIPKKKRASDCLSQAQQDALFAYISSFMFPKPPEVDTIPYHFMDEKAALETQRNLVQVAKAEITTWTLTQRRRDPELSSQSPGDT